MTNVKKIWRLFLRGMENPWALVVAFVAGVVVKTFFPRLSDALAPLSPIYNMLCKFALVPTLFLNIIFSVKDLIGRRKGPAFLGRAWILFCASSLVLFGFAVVLVRFLQLGVDVLNAQEIQASIATSFQVPLVGFDTLLMKVQPQNPVTFVRDSIPESIFAALSAGKMIQVVLSAILLGVALGYLSGRLKGRLSSIFEMLQQPFRVLSSMLLVWLPVGLLLNMAGSFSPKVLLAVGPFLALMTASFFVVIGGGLWGLAWGSKIGFWPLLCQLRETLVLVFSTKQEFVGIPGAVRLFGKNPRLNGSVFSCVLPAGMSVFCFGRLFYYTIILMSASVVYHIHYDWAGYAVGFFSVFLAAVAGDQVEDTIPPMFEPLNVPSVYGTAFFPIVDWAFEPLRAVLSFVVSCGLSLLVSQRGGGPVNSPTFHSGESSRAPELVSTASGLKMGRASD